MITVANRTETAARIKFAFDHKRVHIDELCDAARTLHIDSKIAMAHVERCRKAACWRCGRWSVCDLVGSTALSARLDPEARSPHFSRL
jgi:hypothetical protein